MFMMGWKIKYGCWSMGDWWVKVVQNWQVEFEKEIKKLVQEVGWCSNWLACYESCNAFEIWYYGQGRGLGLIGPNKTRT